METIFIVTEASDFIVTESGDYLIVDERQRAPVERRYTALPITDRFTVLWSIGPGGFNMKAQISPTEQLYDMADGEMHSFELALAQRLKTKTVASYTYKICNSAGTDVTPIFGGGSSILIDVITFGIKPSVSGSYELQFVITCNELLPDNVTPYKFFVNLDLTVI